MIEFFRRPRWPSFTGLYELRRRVCHGVPGFLLLHRRKDDSRDAGRSVLRGGMCLCAAKSPKQHASGSSRVLRRGDRYGLLVSIHRRLTPASRGRLGSTRRTCLRIRDQQLPTWYYSFCVSCGRVFPTTPLVVLHWSIRGSAQSLSRCAGFSFCSAPEG